MQRVFVLVTVLTALAPGRGGNGQTDKAVDGQTNRAVQAAKACIEAKGYRISTNPDERVSIPSSTYPNGFTVFFPSGHTADVAFKVTEDFTGEMSMGAHSASPEQLNSVERATLNACNQEGLDEVPP